MGFLDFIFKKTIQFDHEFFGRMQFLENKKEPLKSYYEGRRQFGPSGRIIEIAIGGDASGPTQKQIAFFKSIEDNYTEVSKAIIPLIEDEFGNWQEGFKINHFQEEFKPVYLQLPRGENNPIVWEIAFESEHDREHTFTLTMADFEAKEIVIDG